MPEQWDLTRRELAVVGIAVAGVLAGCSRPATSGAGGASGASGAGGSATPLDGSPSNGSPSAGPASAASSTGPDPDERGLATVDLGASITDPAGTVALEIGTATGEKDSAYDRTTLTAKAGSRIKVRFENHTDPKAEIGHNWVLVTPGKEDEVVASGKTAGDDKDWVDVEDPAIIAHTRLIEGGQSNTIRFKAPPPGRYTYLCTFPDHYRGGQKGTLVIA